MDRYERSNHNNLLNNLNMTIVSYESDRIMAQKRGDTEKAFIYEKKRQQIEEIRDKIARNELLDEESILKMKELYEKESSEKESFTKMIKIIALTTIIVVFFTFIKIKDIEDAVLVGCIYFMIAYLIGKTIVNKGDKI